MFKNFTNAQIPEHREFTNPRVRFRRINGRVIPILNKQKIGQDLTAAGGTALQGAAALGALAGAKALVKKVIGTKLSGAKPAATFALKQHKSLMWALTPEHPTILARIGGHAAKSAKLALKHPGKLALGLAALGIALRSAGWELEMESEFGKDIGAGK